MIWVWPSALASSATAASMICFSIAPPPTVPRVSPRSSTIIFEPGFCGVLPDVSMTVASTKGRPSSVSFAMSV